MKRVKDKSGFSLAELLVTIAILIILFGIGFVAVMEYQRNLRLNEMDSIAKEIFIAAQNQLSKAKENGTLNQYIEENSKAATPAGNYTIHKDSDISRIYNSSAWNILMPFGSIDDTVRTGGSYIIEFEPTTGTVTQVYYSDNYTFEDYTDELKAGVDDKNRRKRYGESGRNIIGWYRGSADSFDYVKLTDNPVLDVINGDQLKASINGTSLTDRTVLLCIRSVRNNGQPESETTITITDLVNAYVLDDVTDQTLHFKNRVISSNAENSFRPGEDIELFVTVMTSKPNTLSNVLESNHIITNSLFDSVTTESGNPVAQISNIRHLENLDTRVSGISYGTEVTQMNITKAEQVDDLNWAASPFFREETTRFHTGSRPNSETGYCPVDMAVNNFIYEGNDRYIDGILIAGAKNPAGMFGNVTAPMTVNDLELRNFNIHFAALTNLETPYPAGTLVGQGTSLTLTNVVAYNTVKDSATGSEESSLEITSYINAGGLVGSAQSANITGCAAAVYVKSSTGNAGGLVGNLGGGTITDSYFGAHTDNGEFKNPAAAIDAKGRINVYAGSYAGGLVGNGSATITNSYSAGSVYSSHADAKSYTGLLIGKNPAYTNTGCYGAGWMFEENGGKWKPIFPDLDMNDFSKNNMQHPAVYYDDFWKDDYYPYPVISDKNASRTAWFQIQHVGDWALPGYRGDFIND